MGLGKYRSFYLLISSLIIFNVFVLSLPGIRTYATLEVSFGERLPYFLLLPVNLFFFLYILVKDEFLRDFERRLVFLFLVFSRLAFLAARVITDGLVVDGDVGHFFVLGSEVTHSQYPMAGYPPLAVLYFFVLNLLSWDQLSIFRLVFPIGNLFFEALIIWVILEIASHFKNEIWGKYLTLLFVLNPFTLYFWLSKFDIVAVSLVSLSIYFLIKQKIFWSLTFLGTATMVKLFPGVVFPVILLGIFRIFGIKEAVKSTLVFFFILAVFFTPVYFRGNGSFNFLFSVHEKRFMQAESIYYLPSYFLEPGLRVTETGAPWDEVASKVFGNNKVTVVQFLLAALPVLFFLLKKPTSKRTLIFSLCSLLVFVTFNRVFSPQFFLFSFVSYILMTITAVTSKRWLGFATVFLLIVSAANFYIWPLFLHRWFLWSFLFFAINLFLIGGFLLGGLKEGTGG